MSRVSPQPRSEVAPLPPAVWDAASVLLPTPLQTALLHAALLSGPPARGALAEWRSANGDSLNGLWREDLGLPTLLSMLDDSARRGEIELDARLRKRVRAAATRERARARRVDVACREVLSSLQRAAIPTIVLRGVALAHTAYARPGLRHCHDLDLLIRPADLSHARDVLLEAGGCVPRDGALQHASEFPVELHAAPTARADPAAVAGAWARCRDRELAGVNALTLHPVDELLWLCAHALASSRRSSQWAVDAAMLLRSAPFEVGETAARAVELRAVAPAVLCLGWLKDELDAPIPDGAIAELASHVDRGTEAELLAWARQAVGGRALLGRVRRRRQRLSLLWRLAH